ncbi:MAG: transketolase [Clostridia bacterium BRH_c25]|nr:MAG: transketolase [Clostridia bacterium BRH_c25]
MSKMIATRAAYGDALVALGAENNKIVVMDADLSHATMTCGFAESYPHRFFNAGIAEANMTSMAAGMAEMGFIPFISTFALFGAGRAYEQVRNSVAYPNSNVKLAMTHAGITLGEDGGSHEAIEDIALMRVIPGMTILCPCDEKETHKAIRAAADFQGPVYIRLARMPSPVMEDMPFKIGKSNVLREGKDIAIFSCGLMISTALEAAEGLSRKGIDAAVINMYTIKPIDSEMIKKYAAKCSKLVTLEEHSVIGGLGDAVSDVLWELDGVKLKKLGVQDQFGQSGKPAELLKYYRLDVESVTQEIETFIK